MSALSDLLNRAIAEQFPDSSNRDLARRADVSRGTVDNYRKDAVVKPTEEVLQAFHTLLGIPIQELREAAGLPRGGSTPYTPPSEANLLDDRQRKAVDEIIRVIVATRGLSNAVEATTESDAQSKAREDQKSKLSRLIPRDPGPSLDIERANDVETLNPDDEVTEEEFQTAARTVPGKPREQIEYEEHSAAGEGADPEGPEEGA